MHESIGNNQTTMQFSNGASRNREAAATLKSVSRQTLDALTTAAKVLAVVFTLAWAGFVGVFWLNSNVQHGYPKFGSPPVPGDFLSYRYTWEYFLFAIIGLQWIVPYLVAAALVNVRYSLVAEIGKFIVAGVGIATGIMVVLIYFLQGCTCNSAFHLKNLCTEPRACCEIYSTALELCPNVMDCAPQPAKLVSSQLYVWTLWGGLIFVVLDFLVFHLLESIAFYSVRSLRKSE